MVTSAPLLVIRADAANAIGAGHVMRQIALGQAWRELGGTCCFVSRDLPLTMRDRLVEEGFEIVAVSEGSAPQSDVEQLQQVVDQRQAAAVVIDGYHFNQAYCDAVAGLDCATAVTDDFGNLSCYRTDFVLNQNAGVNPETYRNRAATTRLLLGPQYSLIRSELRNSSGRYRQRDGSVQRILVTLGGADPHNCVESVVRSLLRLSSKAVQVRLILGGLYQKSPRLEQLINGDQRFRVLSNVRDMSRHYTWADLAVAAGGSSNWEMCCFRLPRVIVVIADNQREIAETLADHRAAVNLGPAATLDEESVTATVDALMNSPSQVSAMGRAAAAVLDGLGAVRFAAELMNCARKKYRQADTQPDSDESGASKLVFRAAGMDDWELLLAWRNDPQSRSASRNPEAIESESHRRWLAQTIEDPMRILLIAEEGMTPVGTVRVDCDDVSELSWAVAPDMRGRGFGQSMVRQVAQFISGPLRAVAHSDNEASRRIAEGAGFQVDHVDGDWVSFIRMPQVEAHVDM